jgi:Flp pilus assembly protein TadG
MKKLISSSQDRFTRKNANGQTLVEFAMVLPIFLLLLFGIIEIGRFIFYYSSVYTASREAVRFILSGL